MARHKLPEDKKKKEFSITIDDRIIELMDKYIEEKGIKNKSQYIEYLIREDMKNRGEDVEKDF